MAASAEKTLRGTRVLVNELTTSDVRDWMRQVELGILPIDPAGDALFEDVSLDDIARMTTADREWLAEFGPSELRPLADLCKQVNPHFFRLRAVYQAAHLAQIRSVLSAASASTSNETSSS
jgi:hypothetical protein